MYPNKIQSSPVLQLLEFHRATTRASKQARARTSRVRGLRASRNLYKQATATSFKKEARERASRARTPYESPVRARDRGPRISCVFNAIFEAKLQ